MELFEAFAAFPDVEKSIIVKSDVLRQGLRISAPAGHALSRRDDVLFKGFMLFSHDRGAPVMYDDRIPYVFMLEDGTAAGTVIQVRRYDRSPYVIDWDGAGFYLLYGEQSLGRIHFDHPPAYFSRYVDGVPMAAIVYAHNDFLFFTANKHCEHFSNKEQCLFCDLTPHASAQKKGGETMILRKQAEQAAIVLEVAFQEPRFRHLSISGGTILTEYNGKSQLDWYCELLEGIRSRLRVWYPTSFQVSAQDDEGWKRLRDTEVPTIQPNIEVWDRRIFEIACPGKARAVGYDLWIERTLRAVDYWGRGNVNPNFVPGVEMAQPFGFKGVDEAVESTLGGWDYLMKHGVLPRQGQFWVVEQQSRLGGQEPPPLEYYIKIGRGYLQLREKHGYSTPVSTFCRSCLSHGTEYDFAYWHGSSPASRRSELADGAAGGGIKS
ncbi:MAG: hypothetical protein M1358_08580 [Chloroflexi bacterium]|nr:hypothetical protein [Chloroflexota bacterium]